MANTYTQLLIQYVFVVKRRQRLISEDIREDLEKYICGVVSGCKSKPLAIYCNPDHCHLLIGLHPATSIADLARLVKCGSSKWLNTEKGFGGRFRWQVGYGAFSYSRSALSNVARYIHNQPEHHRRKDLREEYVEVLRNNEVVFEEEYLFDG